MFGGYYSSRVNKKNEDYLWNSLLRRGIRRDKIDEIINRTNNIAEQQTMDEIITELRNTEPNVFGEVNVDFEYMDTYKRLNNWNDYAKGKWRELRGLGYDTDEIRALVRAEYYDDIKFPNCEALKNDAFTKARYNRIPSTPSTRPSTPSTRPSTRPPTRPPTPPMFDIDYMTENEDVDEPPTRDEPFDFSFIEKMEMPKPQPKKKKKVIEVEVQPQMRSMVEIINDYASRSNLVDTLRPLYGNKKRKDDIVFKELIRFVNLFMARNLNSNTEQKAQVDIDRLSIKGQGLEDVALDILNTIKTLPQTSVIKPKQNILEWLRGRIQKDNWNGVIIENNEFVYDGFNIVSGSNK